MCDVWCSMFNDCLPQIGACFMHQSHGNTTQLLGMHDDENLL